MTQYDNIYINDMLGNRSWNTTLYKVTNEIDNAFNRAIVNNDISRVKFLLSIKIFQCNDNNIKLAINNDKPEILKLLLESRSIGRDYYELLRYAMNKHNDNAVNIIIDDFIRTDKKHDIQYYTSLIMCIIDHNHTSIIKKIFKFINVWLFIDYYEVIEIQRCVRITKYNKFSLLYKYAQKCNNTDAVNALREALITAFPVKLPDDIIIDIIVKYF